MRGHGRGGCGSRGRVSRRSAAHAEARVRAALSAAHAGGARSPIFAIRAGQLRPDALRRPVGERDQQDQQQPQHQRAPDEPDRRRQHVGRRRGRPCRAPGASRASPPSVAAGRRAARPARRAPLASRMPIASPPSCAGHVVRLRAPAVDGVLEIADDRETRAPSGAPESSRAASSSARAGLPNSARARTSGVVSSPGTLPRHSSASSTAAR